MTTITANELTAGVTFSGEVSGQTVRMSVVCNRGMCSHEKRDRYSVHVRAGSMEFFVAYYDDDTFQTA